MKELFKKYWYVLILVISLILIYVVWYNFNNSDISEPIVYEGASFELENKETVEEIDTYYVDIKGEVVKPGVYEISSSSRIIDVINKAGGLTKNADTSLLNLSKKIKDEMNIRIYSKKEVSLAKESLKKEPEIVEIIKEVEKECVCPEISNKCDNNNDALVDKEILDGISNSDESITNKEEISIKQEEEKKDDELININTASKEKLMSIPNIGESKANGIIEYRNKNRFNKIEDILNVSGIGESVFEKIKTYITV